MAFGTKALRIVTTIPRKVAFAYNDNIVWNLGFYNSCMYAQTILMKCRITYASDIETGDISG
jgi:hypothetical protein